MQLKNFDVDFKETTLVNGVKLYSFYKQNAPIYFRVFFYGGSQYDGDKYGLAHFCEHIMVSGTDKYPTRDTLTEAIENIGVSRNAFTNRKNLWLSFNLAIKEDLPDMFEIVDEILNKSHFLDITIENERRAILAEQTKNRSNPSWLVSELQSTLLFQGTNIAGTILGSDDSVKGITRADLLEYRDKYLVNGQVAYFISGDFDQGEVEGYINKINCSRKPIDIPKIQLPIIENQKVLIKNVPGLEQAYVSLSTRINPVISDAEKVAGDIFNDVVGRGNASRLVKKLRINKGLVYEVSSNFSTNPEFAYFNLITNCKIKDLDEVIKIIKDDLMEITEKGINADELDRAKKNILRRIKFQSETAGFWVSPEMMKEFTSYKEPILIDKFINILESVSVVDVNNFIKKYLEGKELIYVKV